MNGRPESHKVIVCRFFCETLNKTLGRFGNTFKGLFPNTSGMGSASIGDIAIGGLVTVAFVHHLLYVFALISDEAVATMFDEVCLARSEGLVLISFRACHLLSC